MRIFVMSFFVFISIQVIAQAPLGFSWQGVIRDLSGAVLSNHAMTLKFSLIQTAATGTTVYAETHQLTTNGFGLAMVNVGSGSILSGSFSSINWGQGPYFIKIELDLNNSGSFTDVGTQQLMSVPFSLFAQNAGGTMPSGTAPGEMLYWNGTTWLTVPPGQNGNGLVYCDGVPTWGNCPNMPVVGPVNIVAMMIPVTGASCSATVPAGSYAITQKGVCWNLTGAPTLADNVSLAGSGFGSYTVSISPVSANTIYHFRGFATNQVGTTYGPELTISSDNAASMGFPCPGNPTVTDYDGNVYNTVQIGGQCWMKENLKTIHYSDGTAIPLVTDNTTWGNLGYTDKAYSYYDNLVSNVNIYGLLYTWTGAMNGAISSITNPSGIQGACPTGWHLPSDNEWKQLEMVLGMTQAQADATSNRGTDQGGKLKATNLWYSPNTGATNSSGFTALPGGFRINNGSFVGLGNWWTATEVSSSVAWYRYLYYYNAQVSRYDYSKDYGFSVRCVRTIDNLTIPFFNGFLVSNSFMPFP